MKEMTPSEMIYHLIRLGATGDSIPANQVQLLALAQVRKLRKSGRTDEADNILNGLKDSGYNAIRKILR